MNPNSRFLAYLQLFRLPNLFTAIADVAMGFLVVHGVKPDASFVVLVGASCLLYTAGMVLNDVFDYDVDLAERPERPLPSGRVDRRWAKQLGFGMLITGAGIAWIVGPRSGSIASLLAVAVLLYDGGAKKTIAGPVVMGSCRLLNVLLGMSTGLAVASFAGFAVDQLLIAVGIGVYVAGITWFARSEARTSQRGSLTFGLAVMGLGIMLLALLPWSIRLNLTDKLVWPSLLILLMVSVVRRCVMAIAEPTPSRVQQAVKHSILTLIVLDAAVVLAVLGPLPFLAILALLVPTMVLGKWVYST